MRAKGKLAELTTEKSSVASIANEGRFGSIVVGNILAVDQEIHLGLENSITKISYLAQLPSIQHNEKGSFASRHRNQTFNRQLYYPSRPRQSTAAVG